MTQYIHEILDLLGDNQRKLVSLIAMFFASSLLDLAGIGLIVPYFSLLVNQDFEVRGVFKHLVEFMGLSSERRLLIIEIGMALVGIFFIKAIANILIHKEIVTFCQFQQVRLRSFLMQAYQKMPYVDMLQRNSSSFIFNTLDLTGNFTGGVLLVGLKTISESIVGLLIIMLLLWQNASVLVLLVALFGCFFFGFDRLFSHRLQNYGQRCNDRATVIIKGINEGISGFKEIRIFGKESYFHKVVYKASVEFAINSIKKTVISISISYLLEFLTVVFVVAIICGNILLGEDLNMLLPTLAMFAVASVRLKPIVSLLTRSLAQLRFYRDGVSRLHTDWLMLKKSDSQDNKTLVPVKSKEDFRELTLRYINFSYPQAKVMALENVSLEINSGESIGIIGPSGAGKTTLVDILLGLLEPQEGELRYNGELMEGSLAEWRSQIAYLPQQVFLIDNSLRKNVALGLNDAEIDELCIRESLRQARLEKLVGQLPNGVDTNIGERGVRLSGGQRQRVALARAFYHNRNILVMDEATSALDNETELEIIEEIKHFKGRKTLIVIAHRLTTVQYCDRIYRMDEGRIIESGTPQTVLTPRKDFRHMEQKQNKTENLS